VPRVYLYAVRAPRKTETDLAAAGGTAWRRVGGGVGGVCGEGVAVPGKRTFRSLFTRTAGPQ
jgi:hypothetical protein